MTDSKHSITFLPRDWHQRFLAQEIWTNSIRAHVYTQIVLPKHPKILEVGSGTGAILSKTPDLGADIYGIDLNSSYLRFCHSENPQFRLACADGLHLPFPERTFDAVYCHYLLLWVNDPVQLVREMIRAGKPGGYIMLFAEPDYGGRIDYPAPLQHLGKAQTEALEYQGADPFIGRKLKEIAIEAGLPDYHSGILGNETDQSFSLPYWASEWDMFEHDLQGILTANEMEELKQLDYQSHNMGVRTLYVPTFYLWAKIP